MRYFFVLIVLVFTISFAPGGYRIELQVPSWALKTVYLVYTVDTTIRMADSARADATGRVLFEGPKRLQSGIYSAVAVKDTAISLLIDRIQFFQVQSKSGELGLSFDGCDECQEYDQLQHSSLVTNEQWLSRYKPGSGSLLSAWAGLQISPKPALDKNKPLTPEAFKNQLIYLRSHYFDYTDFSHPGICYTDEYNGKLHQYFSRLLPQQRDTLIKYIDEVATRASVNEYVYRYTLTWLLMHFRQQNTQIAEQVFFHLSDHYFLAGKVSGVERNYLRALKHQTDAMRSSIPGQKADDLLLEDTSDLPMRLSDVKARYTVLFFWDADCAFCKAQITRLKQLQKQHKKQGLKVVAVYVHADKAYWLSKISEYQISDWVNLYDPTLTSRFAEKYRLSTIPAIYLLDNDKNILLSKTTPEFITDFYKNERK